MVKVGSEEILVQFGGLLEDVKRRTSTQSTSHMCIDNLQAEYIARVDPTEPGYVRQP